MVMSPRQRTGCDIISARWPGLSPRSGIVPGIIFHVRKLKITVDVSACIRVAFLLLLLLRLGIGFPGGRLEDLQETQGSGIDTHVLRITAIAHLIASASSERERAPCDNHTQDN